MRQWSALLEAELLRRPRVIAKPMFGFRSFYRGKTIFAAIPRSREFDPVGSIIMKFNPVPAALAEKIKAEPRIAERAPGPGAGWHAFEVGSHEDIKDALWWLSQAYEHVK